VDVGLGLAVGVRTGVGVILEVGMAVGGEEVWTDWGADVGIAEIGRW